MRKSDKPRPRFELFSYKQMDDFHRAPVQWEEICRRCGADMGKHADELEGRGTTEYFQVHRGVPVPSSQ